MLIGAPGAQEIGVDLPSHSSESGDAHDDIARLEERIEGLCESIERCRKLSLAAKLAIAAGAVWLSLVVLHVLSFDPFGLTAATAAVIGGIVLLGSNDSTWKQTEAALRQTEALRAELIERMALRVVEERRWLH